MIERLVVRYPTTLALTVAIVVLILVACGAQCQ